jgi:hypothetical protein
VERRAFLLLPASTVLVQPPIWFRITYLNQRTGSRFSSEWYKAAPKLDLSRLARAVAIHNALNTLYYRILEFRRSWTRPR